jgi:very-short-patch-repair endonuclease
MMVTPCTSANITAWNVPHSNGKTRQWRLQKEEDERREKVLSEMGLRVVRFRNDQVMRNLSAVAGKIRELAFQ